jgi:putative redox protein
MARIIASAEALNNADSKRVHVTAGDIAHLSGDAIEYGSNTMGPSPGDYLCMSLASCQAITLRQFAKRKKWKIDSINVKVSLVKWDQAETARNTFFVELILGGDLNASQRKQLMEIARSCPVHRLLGKPSDVVMVIT